MRLAKDKAEATVSELESKVQMHRAAAAALKQVSADPNHMLLGVFMQSGVAVRLMPARGKGVHRHAAAPHTEQGKCHPGLYTVVQTGTP